jgi:hypothetical protein
MLRSADTGFSTAESHRNSRWDELAHSESIRIEKVVAAVNSSAPLAL